MAPDQGDRADGAEDALLERGGPGARPVAVEEEELVDEDPDEDPGERQLQDVARQDEERDGREREEKPAGEGALPGVAVEVVAAELDDDHAEEGHQHDHRGRERVERDLEAEVCCTEERRGRGAVREGGDGCEDREDERREGRAAGDRQHIRRAQAGLREGIGAGGGEEGGQGGGQERDHGSSPFQGSRRGSGVSWRSEI